MSSPQQQQRQLTVCVLQPPLRKPQETPMEATKAVLSLMEEACLTTTSSTLQNNVHNHVDLIMLPELCPVGYSEDTFAKYLPSTLEIQNMYLQIDTQFREAAKKLKSAICYGTIGWQLKEAVQEAQATEESTVTLEYEYFIRHVVVDASGVQIASYDKIHLCNYGDCAETRFFTPGTKLVSFAVKDWKFGLIICADMRYPVQSQRLVKDHGVHVILQPACFIRDISFRTWKSFRETRAVENGVYFLAGNYAGEDFGEASIVPPWVDEHHEPQVLDTKVGYLIEALDQQVLNFARTELPFYKHVCETSRCDM
jgi:predicted amidohydrolase